MSGRKRGNVCKFVAKVLVFFMVIQGMPLWELSRAYEWEFQPEKIQRVLDVVVSMLFSPKNAYAGVAPDPNDYTINEIPENFVDISATGTELSLGDDVGVPGVAIGFEFEFFGNTFNSVTVTADGYMAFPTLISPENAPIPMPDTPNDFIAPFWDDLNPELNSESIILYSTVGTAPNRQFIVEWKDVPLKTDPDSRLTFEVVLFETSNEIQFHYLSMIDGRGFTSSNRITGSSATIGIENADGTKGHEVGFNKSHAVAGGSAFSFTLAGNAFETGRYLGDLNGDGQINILDQTILTYFIIENEQVRPSLDLVLSDIAPVPGPDDGAFGDRVINASDHDRIFETLMGRENLNPTLELASYLLATPGETLTIYGSGFDSSLAANNIVAFINVDGAEIQVAAESVTPEEDQLTVIVPAGTEYISSVRVATIGLNSNSILFLLEDAPLVAGMSPGFGEEGDIILLKGFEFGLTPEDNLVTFNGIEATVNSVINSNGIDILNVTVPEGAGPGPVVVSVGSQPSNEMAFVYDGPPIVAINTPDDGGEVGGLVDISGTASDLKLVNYTLEYAPLDGDFTIFATGTDSVEDDVLGTLDTTLLVNGFYQLRLIAEDEGGNVSSTTRDVVVTGHNKPGINTITFTDLQVPVSGIPITIRRKYDSRVKTKKDFGVGWSLEILDVELYENQTPGDGWYPVNTGALFPNWELRSARVHLALVRFPDGRTDVFEMKAYFDDPVNRTGNTGFVTFEPRQGNTSALDPLTGVDVVYSGGQLSDWYTGSLYDPDSYRLTTQDGIKLVISQSTGLESIEDPNGNTLTISSNGIVHSSGKSISFTRDSEGRIRYIHDPMNNWLEYTYDSNGDLVSFRDREYKAVTYTYDGEHNLIDYIDPRRVTFFSSEYDENGRLIATRDANGNRIELSYDLDNYTSTVRNRLGNVTVYESDERGNVIRKVDPLGNTTTYAYDARGNKLTETDPLGRTVNWTYDENNNVLTQTDFEGNTTSYTYNWRGRILTSTDAEGRVTTNVYDVNGNLTEVTDPEGGIRRYTYDARGNILTETDPLGNLTQYSYDVSGNLISKTDSLGNMRTYTYDDNGNQLSKTRTRTLPDGTTQTLVERFVWDSNGRQVRSIDSLGNEAVFTYSPTGDDNIETITDKNGTVTRHEYDDVGNLVRTTFPDGSTEESAYDAEGHLIRKTDRDGNVTEFEYDALGRLINTIHPDGAVVGTSYDEVGRILSQTDELGNVTMYSYEPNGQRVTDALGNETLHTFDSHDRRMQMTDANGHTTTFTYDSKGNGIVTTFPDGTAKTTVYDAAGRKVSETDQAGHTTTFAYDAVGRLIGVTDALGKVTAYAYDEVGNRISQTDAEGRTTRMAYDDMGRMTKRVLPRGQEEAFTYDGLGNKLTHTDFNGDTTIFAYDSNSRLVERRLPDGSTTSFVYTATGLRTQAGNDAYTYDARGRLLTETKTNGNVIAYAYDAGGNRMSLSTPQGMTTYTYDALNRLATVTDPYGNVTTYGYDAVGNLARVTYPNGTATTYMYNALKRLTGIDNTGPGGAISSYTYTLGSAGNRTGVVEDHSGRTVEYTYDAVYRLTAETIDDPVHGHRTITYTYDAAGNRLSKNDSADGVATYTYDDNDHLLSETGVSGIVTYDYDENGNMLGRSESLDTNVYNYNSENHLISAEIQQDTTPIQIDYTYDVDGIRTSTSAGGVFTEYLVDKAMWRGCPKNAIPSCCPGAAPNFERVVMETQGDTVVNYTYGHDLISMTRTDADTSFYHYDGQMSTRQLTDTTGSVTDTYTYDAFGILIVSTGVTLNDFLYTGEQLDPNVGFYYLRARYYAPAIGRFLTTDPETGSVFDPSSLHWYQYVNADPVNNLDPSGRLGLTMSGVMGALTFRNILYVSLGAGAVSSIGTMIWTRGNIEKSLAVGAMVTVTTFIVLGMIAYFGPAIIGPGATQSDKIRQTWMSVYRLYDRLETSRARENLQRFVEREFHSRHARCVFLRQLSQAIPATTLLERGTDALGGFGNYVEPGYFREIKTNIVDPLVQFYCTVAG